MSKKGEALYDQARMAPNGKRRARLILLGNLASAEEQPDEAVVWMYVGMVIDGELEPGAMRLGDLRAFLH